VAPREDLVSRANPRTGPELVPALGDALPGWNVELGCRAEEGAGTIVRVSTADGRLALITSRQRREVRRRNGTSEYQPARPEHQGERGFRRLVEDLRASAATPLNDTGATT
jgi:hypothetical protein